MIDKRWVPLIGGATLAVCAIGIVLSKRATTDIVLMVMAIITVLLLAFHYFARNRDSRRRREWELAVHNAYWEPYSITTSGITSVGLLRVARTKHRIGVVSTDEAFVSFTTGDPDWEQKHVNAMFEARQRCIALNAEINSNK
jgi:preprotein translocase subunit YajC